MQIYLARHGQSRWQVERRDGDWDSPLTAVGQAQAAHLAEWLAGRPRLDNGAYLEIKQALSSPLQRARDTAVTVAESLSLTITLEDNLREADFYVSEHLPQTASPYQAAPRYSPPAQYAAFKEQTRRALDALVAAAESADGPVLGVAHGGLISTLLRLAVGSDSVSFWIYNASLQLIEWKRGRWHLVHLNLWDHLPPELRTY
ncbi:MAG: histidine phosphatase family protein [Chloroflexi bacterium]|nr:histidine phosphatase family protein [Chloroflexota bacterium]